MPGSMPAIGITQYRKLEDYQHAVQHAGGEVRVLDAAMSVDEALRGLDALLLSGGADVSPARYGEERHPSVTDVLEDRDAFEIDLVLEARRRRLPMLGICRGIQILNVACGGSLVQDIPSQVPGALAHSLTVPPNAPMALAHEIWIDPGSLLARLMREALGGGDTCEVNSRHHQAVRDVAPGFRVSATAPDGVVEAIEDPQYPFCLGVQWHPENFWRTGEFRALFEGLLGAVQPRRS